MIAIVTGVSFFAATANAATPSFSAVDVNNDNMVSWDELSNALPNTNLYDFSLVDRNGDGAISEDEMSNGIEYLDQEPEDTSALSNDSTPVDNVAPAPKDG